MPDWHLHLYLHTPIGIIHTIIHILHGDGTIGDRTHLGIGDIRGIMDGILSGGQTIGHVGIVDTIGIIAGVGTTTGVRIIGGMDGQVRHGDTRLLHVHHMYLIRDINPVITKMDDAHLEQIVPHPQQARHWEIAVHRHHAPL